MATNKQPAPSLLKKAPAPIPTHIYFPVWEDRFHKINEGDVYCIDGKLYCLRSGLQYNIAGVKTNNSKSDHALADGESGLVLINKLLLVYNNLLGASCSLEFKRYSKNPIKI